MKNSTAPGSASEGLTPLLSTRSMSIEEVLRIMDVASEFRKQKDLVEREFRNEESQEELRNKLMDAAKVTGEEISEEEINSAIDWYYDHLYTFKPPRFGIGLIVAHLYIRRILVITILIGLGFMYFAYKLFT